MGNTNLKTIKNSYGRVVYSHKIHEKSAEMAYSKMRLTKCFNIILTTLVASGLVSVIVTNHIVLSYITGTLSAITLGFMIFQLSFDPGQEAEKHRQTAKELWFIRERYFNLISDITNTNISTKDIIMHRDSLIRELGVIYKFAPPTNKKAYKLAKDALKLREEMTFTDIEINQFLPEKL